MYDYREFFVILISIYHYLYSNTGKQIGTRLKRDFSLPEPRRFPKYLNLKTLKYGLQEAVAVLSIQNCRWR